MGWKDWFRWRRPPRPHTERAQRRLSRAIRRAGKRPSDARRAVLHDALLDGMLLLAVDTQPAVVPNVPVPPQAKVAAPYSRKNASGGEVLLAFSDVDELAAQAPKAAVMELPAGGVFRLMLDGGYAALLLNSAGASIELSRDEVHALRERENAR